MTRALTGRNVDIALLTELASDNRIINYKYHAPDGA